MSGTDVREYRAARPLGRGPSRPDRIRAHVRTVEDTLTRQLDDLTQEWDAITDASSACRLHLPDQLRGLLARGGKRTRPIMTFLGWLAADVHDERRGADDMVLAAAAIEMLHCFALVHDDVMDESPTRRGQPTVHAYAAGVHDRSRGTGASGRFGDSIAMLVGDLAHSEADRLAATLPLPMRRVWRQMVLELIEGQTADVVGSAIGDRRLEYALSVARKKTGFYTVARPLQLGALAATADERALRALGEFGRHAGEAFALRDDVLGVYGDPKMTGKPAGDDIRSGKPTVLLALATDTFRGGAAAALRKVGTDTMTDDQVRTVQEQMVRQGVLATVETMIEDRVRDALGALDPVALSVDGIAELTRVVDDLTRRGR